VRPMPFPQTFSSLATLTNLPPSFDWQTPCPFFFPRPRQTTPCPLERFTISSTKISPLRLFFSAIVPHFPFRRLRTSFQFRHLSCLTKVAPRRFGLFQYTPFSYRITRTTFSSCVLTVCLFCVRKTFDRGTREFLSCSLCFLSPM